MDRCQRCARSHAEAFAVGGAMVCLTCAVRDARMLRRAFATSLVVGTLLLVINHGDALVHGAWPLALAWKIPLTYAVPFAVCMWGGLSAARRPG